MSNINIHNNFGGSSTSARSSALTAKHIDLNEDEYKQMQIERKMKAWRGTYEGITEAINERFSCTLDSLGHARLISFEDGRELDLKIRNDEETPLIGDWEVDGEYAVVRMVQYRTGNRIGYSGPSGGGFFGFTGIPEDKLSKDASNYITMRMHFDSNDVVDFAKFDYRAYRYLLEDYTVGATGDIPSKSYKKGDKVGWTATDSLKENEAFKKFDFTGGIAIQKGVRKLVDEDFLIIPKF